MSGAWRGETKLSEYVTRWVSAGPARTEEKRLLGRGTKTKEDPQNVDRAGLAAEIEAVCNALHDEGYDIVSVFPTLRGHSASGMTANGGWGYGFSVTDGAIITARRRGG